MSKVKLGESWVKNSDGLLVRPGRISRGTVGQPSNPLSVPGFTLVRDEQFASIDPAIWYKYNNSNFGSNQRIGTWWEDHLVIGDASAGATNNQSLKMLSTEIDNGTGTLPFAGALTDGSAGTRYAYRGGMMDTKSAATPGGWGAPLYFMIDFREKICHGQGLWHSSWLTALNGGANLCELDLIEYFHAGAPGHNSVTIHRTPYQGGTLVTNAFTNNGKAANQYWGRTFFETPTYTPDWNVWRFIGQPVTDPSGTVLGDPHQPSQYFRLQCYLNGMYQGMLIDNQALWWTSQAGTYEKAWNIYLQGCQFDGKSVGHPRSPLGYSHQTDSCLLGGTKPNACTISYNGCITQPPVFGDPSSTVEIDYVRIWQWTG